DHHPAICSVSHESSRMVQIRANLERRGLEMRDPVGQQLGNYRLLHVLGEGSFATVYLGEPLDSPAQVAIKVFRKPLSAEEGELFRQDEALLTRLTHPHLVRVFACGTEGTTAFEVMAYVFGDT